ncbi:MAG: ABC-type transport system involved in cytochrome c biosis, permease component [Acidimicrobiales bacterium]|nr:ABC-type transport system involved in cytochrome c biosis, permease component [Acidimicrobiales bacterium]
MNAARGNAVTLALGIVALLSLAATVVLGLSLPTTVEQDDYSKLIAIHPGLAWASYVAFGVTALASLLWLWPTTRSRTADLVAGASAEAGVVFTALTLLTGSIWGRPTWGTWWVWDARLTLSALMLALYLGYLALRRVPADADTRARRAAVAAVLAVLVVPVNHFAVEWWRTLHQGRSLNQLEPGNDLDGIFIGAMLLGFLAMTLTYVWFVLTRLRTARLEAELEDVALDVAIAERRAEAVEVLTP